MVIKKGFQKTIFTLFALILSSAVNIEAIDLKGYFVILKNSANINDEVEQLKPLGARIRQRIPPRILIVDLPAHKTLNHLPSERIFTGPVPIADIVSMGPMAVAAGLEWNKSTVHNANRRGNQSFSSAQSLAAHHSYPPPSGIHVSPSSDQLSVSWDPVFGASSYEIHVAKDNSFNDILIMHQTDRNQVFLPRPTGLSQNSIAVRVRSLESHTPGTWSPTSIFTVNNFSTSMSLNPPALTSPLNNYRSEGFTLILEWTAHTGSRSRIQVARDANFNDLITDSTSSEREWVIPSSILSLGESYYWRVKAWGAQSSAWTTPRSFTVGSPRNHGSDMMVNPERPR